MAAADVPIDALAYVDVEYNDPAVRLEVRNMIEEEMACFEPIDYLAAKQMQPHISKIKPGSILATEMGRLAKGAPMRGLDLTRYDVQPPALDKQNDVAAWEKAVNNAKAQLQHQTNRQLHLELLGNYGANAWLYHNKASLIHKVCS
jgi:pre-mRNA-splicing factor SPF27